MSEGRDAPNQPNEALGDATAEIAPPISTQEEDPARDPAENTPHDPAHNFGDAGDEAQPPTQKNERFRLKDLHPKRFFLETWREIDRDRDPDGGFDPLPLAMVLTVCAGLTFTEYYGGGATFRALQQTIMEGEGFLSNFKPLLERARESTYWGLSSHAYWSITRLLAWVVLPMLVLLAFRRNPLDFGLRWGKSGAHWPLYVLSAAVVIPLVFIVAKRPDFGNYYPFYKQAGRSYADFFFWQLFYAGQFFAVEFIFRGFMVEAGRKAYGSQAIFVMVIPYVMIHYGKPIPETIGAIIAGVVLGTLAMRTRSIWPGLFVHLLVAITMDFASLSEQGALPTELWPPID